MAEQSHPDLGWRDVAEAVPGGVAVQVGETFAHVTADLAALVGVDADALVGESWRTLFDARETTRLASAVERARETGRWEGAARTGGRRASGTTLDLTLSATGSDAVVWTVSEVTGDRSERTAGPNDRTPDRPGVVRSVLDAVGDVVYVIDEDGQFVLWNDAITEVTGFSHADIAGMEPAELIPEDHHEYVPGLNESIDAIEDRRVDVDVLTADGERVTHEFTGTTFEDPATGERFRCGVARDVTDQRARERALERQRDELAALDRINELLLDTVRELVQTASREAVERIVCERLVSSPFYEFAWVGGRGLDGDGIRRRSAAGTDRGLHDAVDPGDVAPVRRAIDTGEVQVAVVGDGASPTGDRAGPESDRWESEDEPWRTAARECGFTSVVAVPIRYDETVYGVLVVHADREDAVGEREQAGFDVLGRTVGVVVHAARSRELLFADGVVELEFAVEDAADVLVEAAAANDCTLSLDGYVAVDDRWITYLTVEGAPPTTVVDWVVEAPGVERARVVGDAGDSSRVEVVVTGSSLVDAAADADATVRRLTATPGEARLVLETSPEADLRGVVEHLRTGHPDVDHVATRDRDREVTVAGRPDGILDGLTERQREALQTAYRAGYYAWPRESTAEEVAAALDLAPPTLHGHLRKAEGAILAALLDGD